MTRFKLGRRPMVAPKTCMRFADYQTKKFPTPPASGDYRAKAQAALSDIYLNDKYGDCVIAWMGHAVGVFTGNATGTPVVFTDDQITSMYSAICQFDPANPQATDNGCDENAALDYWKATGFVSPEHKIAGFLSVDATDFAECQAATWLFENVMFGVGLPQAWVDGMNDMKDGFVWDVAGPPIADNGHCFGAMKWGPDGLGIDTWAIEGRITPAAIAKYAVNEAGGQLFTVITQEILDRATAKAPNGFDFAQLTVDFNGMGGVLSLA